MFEQKVFLEAKIYKSMKRLDLSIRSKTFGERKILSSISFSFSCPGLYVLKGENGSGKSTLLSIVSGHDQDFEGSILLDGKEINRKSLPDYFEKHVTYVPQNSIVFGSDTCLENLLCAIKKNERDVEKARSVLKFLGLERVEKSLGKDLSSGERQRLAFGRCLYFSNDIILLDEVTSNLDHESRGYIEKGIEELSKSHLVIFVTHEDSSLESLEETYVLLLDHGRLKTVKEGKEVEGSPSAAKKEAPVFSSIWPVIFGNIKGSKRIFASFASILAFCYCLMAVFFTFGSSFTQERIFDLGKEELYKSLPMIVCSESDLNDFAISNPDVNLCSFDYLNLSAKWKEGSQSELDYHSYLGGCLYLPDEDALSSINSCLLFGRFPSSSDEILISLSTFEAIGGNIDTDVSFDEIASRLVFNSSIGGEVFKAVGVYEDFGDTEWLDSVAKAAARLYGTFVGMDVFGPSSIGICTAIRGGSPKFQSDSDAIVINDCLRSLSPSTLASRYRFYLSASDCIFLCDSNGESLTQGLSYSSSWNMLGYIGFSGSLILSFVVIYSYCRSNKRRFSFLRAIGHSRRRLLFSSASLFLIGLTLGIFFGMLLGVIAAWSVQLFLNNAIVGQTLDFISFSLSGSLFIVGSTLAASAFIFSLVFLYLLPKNDKFLLTEMKRK